MSQYALLSKQGSAEHPGLKGISFSNSLAKDIMMMTWEMCKR